MKAFVHIRNLPFYRRYAFTAGLEKLGYTIVFGGCPSSKDDVLLIWNRYGHFDSLARTAINHGSKVLVAENGYLGRDYNGQHWYSLARDNHNGAGSWEVGDQSRLERLALKLEPWRTGSEIVVLMTRSIGPSGVAEPRGWSSQIAAWLKAITNRPVRMRPHPGENKHVPLEIDLKNAHSVVTWGSGAALKAIAMGIPAFYGFKNWIGASAGQPIELSRGCDIENTYTGDRLSMFHRLSWAMWTTDELATGEPLKCLLK